MRIGISCYSTFGGSGSVASEIGIGLSNRGHEVHILSSAIPPRLNIHRNEVYFHEVTPSPYPLFESPLYGDALASKMADITQKYNLDIIHAHYAIPHASSALLAKMACDNKVKVVTTLHGTDITIVGADPSYFPMVRLAIKQSDAVTAVSQFLKKQTIETFGVGDQIEVISNFVCSHDLIHSHRDDKSTQIQEIPNLIHVSNFRPVKRVLDVVKIYEKVRINIPCNLILIGDGPDRSEIGTYCRKLPFWNDIHILGKQHQVENYLSRSTVFILPSETESFGLSALEAMSLGVPVVATSIGGLPELIRDMIDGFLHPIGDIDSMARSVSHLLEDKDLRSRMSASSKKRAFDSFGEKPIIDAYEAIYNRVLSNK